MSLFPMANHDQKISNWIKPSDADYEKLLLSDDLQQKRMQEFYRHVFGEISPWNEDHVTKVINTAAPYDLLTMERALTVEYSNRDKPEKEIVYGENFRPHTQEWIDAIRDNMNIQQFKNIRYHASLRGITIDNTHVRALPTNDIHFYHYKFAGQGYPFDNLQMEAVWAGTPVYVIGESKDHAWLLVLTPDVIGWVPSNNIAYTDDAFIQKWQTAAQQQLIAVTKTQASLLDDNNQYMLTAYVGTVFTAAADHKHLMVPAADVNHHAVVRLAVFNNEQAAAMPLSATPHHFADIMQTLIGRPYGWGGVNFYNDCSAEMKNLFTPFGIWLPRHSSEQLNMGKMVDLHKLPAKKRLDYLKKNGHKFLTLIYVGNHIILYIGNYQYVMTYQDMWGLRPTPATRRVVIGKSVIFPMPLKYAEDSSLVSQAAKKHFEISFLDEMPAKQNKHKFDLNKNIIRRLILPDFGLLNDLIR